MFVVTHFEVKALDEQLHKAAPAIDQALALQEAAVTVIAEQMKAALGASLEVRESTDVVDPTMVLFFIHLETRQVNLAGFTRYRIRRGWSSRRET
jgi:hypothetical protein